MKGQQKLIYDEVKEFLRKFNDDINIFPKEETQSIITLFKSTKPYAGGLIPKAKSTMALLDKKLEILLSKAKENAEIEINKVKSKIQKNSEFANLSSDQKEAILEINYQAKNDVLNADRPGAIFLRMQRYRNEEKPRQLQEIATLSRAKFSEDITPEPITVVPSSELKTNCDLSQITNDIELEKWLDSLRTAAQKELNDGNRISL